MLDKSLIVVVGPGGVGKTTLSAALAILGSLLGKKTLVLTIDPAKRLANALGLRDLAPRPQPIPERFFSLMGLMPPVLTHVMMLDLKDAWDQLVNRYCSDAQLQEQIWGNRFYQYLSEELPGSQEFVACEALFDIATRSDYDLIVLDTPPTTHALDFLDAPSKVIQFLDQDWLKPFVRSSKPWVGNLGLKLFDGASVLVSPVLSKLMGAGFLEELSQFLHLFRDFYGPLTMRAREFQDWLKSEAAGFCIAASPKPGPLSEAEALLMALNKRELPFAKIIFNMVHQMPGLGDEQGQQNWGEQPLTRLYQKAYEQLGEQVKNDTDLMDAFLQRTQLRDKQNWVSVPNVANRLEKSAHFRELLLALQGQL